MGGLEQKMESGGGGHETRGRINETPEATVVSALPSNCYFTRIQTARTLQQDCSSD
jgi:hypothetical protein